MRLPSGYHLTYCTNIHPGTDWDTTFRALKNHVPQIKKAVCPDGEFGVGLRLSNIASVELLKGNTLGEFKEWLAGEGLYVFTLNGFPYGEFHDTAVKDAVHQPDWTSPDRLAYTLRLFDILAALIPDGVEGGISTSPLSYRHWHNGKMELEEVYREACSNLGSVVAHLAKIEQETGAYLHLDLEPEPDGLLQNSEEVIHFFKDYAFPLLGRQLPSLLSISPQEARSLIGRHLTLCYDACHYALAYENPADTFKAMDELGLRIGKIQLSSALKARFDNRDNKKVWKALEKFREPVYLHQVSVKGDKGVTVYPDLDPVLSEQPATGELRAHFHVPVFLTRFEVLETTQDHLSAVLRYLIKNPITVHLEIETYTWKVFPEAMKSSLAAMVIEEFQWVMRNLEKHE